MNYRQFYHDVVLWMDENNQRVGQQTIESDSYWDWVVHSTGKLCNKYNNHPLVVMQMSMLIEYLEKSYKDMKKSRV